MLTKLSAALLIVAMLCVIGCAALIHKVGNGAQRHRAHGRAAMVCPVGINPH